MELMLIVWLVSILSSIKAFVSSYIFYILTVLLIVFVGSKINDKVISKAVDARQEWGDGVRVLQQDCLIGDVVVQKGTVISLSAYADYAYVTCDQMNIKAHRTQRKQLENAILYGEPPAVTEVAVPWLVGVIPNRLAYMCYALIGLQVLLPSDNTIKYMAGAYLIQSTYDSEFVQTALPLGQKAVINQLERWSKDSEELKDLLIEGTTTK